MFQNSAKPCMAPNKTIPQKKSVLTHELKKYAKRFEQNRESAIMHGVVYRRSARIGGAYAAFDPEYTLSGDAVIRNLSRQR